MNEASFFYYPSINSGNEAHQCESLCAESCVSVCTKAIQHGFITP